MVFQWQNFYLSTHNPFKTTSLLTTVDSNPARSFAMGSNGSTQSLGQLRALWRVSGTFYELHHRVYQYAEEVAVLRFRVVLWR